MVIGDIDDFNTELGDAVWSLVSQLGFTDVKNSNMKVACYTCSSLSPRLSAHEASLLVLAIGWMFAVDDLFDDRTLSSDEMAALTKVWERVWFGDCRQSDLQHTLTKPLAYLAKAFAQFPRFETHKIDIWRAISRMISAMHQESVWTELPAEQDYLDNGIWSIGVPVINAMLNCLFDVAGDSELQTLNVLCSKMVRLANDMATNQRELAEGKHNLLSYIPISSAAHLLSETKAQCQGYLARRGDEDVAVAYWRFADLSCRIYASMDYRLE